MTDTLFWDVDTQVDFMRASGALYVPDAEAIIPALGRLTRHAHDRGIPILASADDHQPGDAELSATPDFKVTYPPHCLHGTPGQAKIAETTLRNVLHVGPEPMEHSALTRTVRKHGGDFYLTKRRFDVFSNANATGVVLAIIPEHIVVYGVALDVCVKHALDGLLQYWPTARYSLVTDATRAIRTEGMKALLDGWVKLGVALVTTDEVIATT